MLLNGIVGLTAAGLGWGMHIGTAVGFIVFWGVASIVALAGSFLLVRRQALKEAEPFWSPPARRVSQAFAPPLFVGLAVGLIVLAQSLRSPKPVDLSDLLWLPLLWIVLYGCAFHASGFFMPRGMKLFGWAFVLGGCAFGALGLSFVEHPAGYAHGLMGCFFGGLHLAYGIYLYFTEQRRQAS